MGILLIIILIQNNRKLMKSTYYVRGFILICIIFIIYMFYVNNRNIDALLKNSKYTVAIVTSEKHAKSTFKSFGHDFEYKLNDEDYMRQTSENLVKGQKYLLVFDSLNPKYSMILAIYPIFHEIKIPKNGWKYDEVPMKIDTLKIKKYISSSR